MPVKGHQNPRSSHMDASPWCAVIVDFIWNNICYNESCDVQSHIFYQLADFAIVNIIGTHFSKIIIVGILKYLPDLTSTKAHITCRSFDSSRVNCRCILYQNVHDWNSTQSGKRGTKGCILTPIRFTAAVILEDKPSPSALYYVSASCFMTHLVFIA